MCGLVGLAFAGDVKFDLNASLDLMQNRGPDDRDIYVDDGIALGHVRLSIIDLSIDARQPLTSKCGRYRIVFNGEIYNYLEIRKSIGPEYDWTSHSDTEVILASYLKWGEKCVTYFHGMFSFAIWDKKKSVLFAARDRLGVKPFYYACIQQGLAFASRPGALCALLPSTQFDIDSQGIRFFLEAGYIPAPNSIFRQIRKLPPGHTLSFDGSNLDIHCYWSLDGLEVDRKLNNVAEDLLLEELDELVAKSIRWRMVSDVPIGVFLSGGIDSSLVAAYMGKYSSDPVKTFSIGFEEKAFDESLHAEKVARHLMTDHFCDQLSANDLLDLVPEFLSQYDEPFFDYSAFPVMAVSKLARLHVKVALSGDGGDEAFGGYHYYRIMQHMERVLPMPGFIRHALGRILRQLPQHKINLLGELLLRDDLPTAFAFMRSVIKHNQNVMSVDLLDSTEGIDDLFAKRSLVMPTNIDASELGMRLDTSYTLPDDYLQKVDVGSMAFSLEVRDPLLDHSIFEWATRLPTQWKIRGGTNKYLLRKLSYKYLPRAIMDRPKMGFGVPMADWLRGPLRSWAEELLSNTAALEELGLDASNVRGIWNKHQSMKVQAHTILWSILVLLAFYLNDPGKQDSI